MRQICVSLSAANTVSKLNLQTLQTFPWYPDANVNNFLMGF